MNTLKYRGEVSVYFFENQGLPSQVNLQPDINYMYNTGSRVKMSFNKLPRISKYIYNDNDYMYILINWSTQYTRK